MKKFILCIVVLQSFATIIFAQPTGWSEDTIIPAPPHLNCVSSYVCVYRPFRSCWIGGNNGTILFTSNNGANWIYKTSSLVGNNNINTIAAVNDTVALCAFNSSDTTYIIRTTNSGLNWQTVFQQKNGFIRSIKLDLDDPCFRNAAYSVGDPVGGRWTILKTTNGGASFDSSGLFIPQSGSEISFNNSLDAWYQYAMFGTNSSKIYRTSNNGLNWTSASVPFQMISSLCYGGPNLTSYAAGGILTAKSTNYGQNWQSVTLPGTGNCVFNNNDGWYTRGSEIYKAGVTDFVLAYTSPSGGNYTDISIFTSIFESGIVAGWAVKDNGTVSKYYAFLAGVIKTSNKIPYKFTLSQNYPNPFNPKTIINFQLPMFSNVKIIIYDILGREVAAIVNEQVKPGTYEVEFDGTNYPSGVYFYKLTTESFSETKRMVLIK
jgi:hypothetical protein